MNNEYLNIYNNLIKLTRNKNLYINLKNDDTFSDRLIILLFHFGFFLKVYKKDMTKSEAQNLFDYIIRQIELSIREIGYGDVAVNKKMKDYVNLFFSILDKIEQWDGQNTTKKNETIGSLMNIKDDSDFIVNYFDNFYVFLSKNSLKIFTKDIIELKF